MRTLEVTASLSALLLALGCVYVSDGGLGDVSPVGSGGGGSGGGGAASGGASVGSGAAGPAGSGGETSGGSSGGSAATGGAPSSGGAGAGGGSGGALEPAFSYFYATTVESTGADCSVPPLAEPAELPSIAKLPDPFTRIDGTRLTKKSEWRCRREEINQQAQRYIYGEKPTPDLVSGVVSEAQVSVHVEAQGTAIDFNAQVVLPPGEGPFPAIINVGAKGGFGGISLGEERILGMGVGIIYFNHGELGQEGVAEQSRGDPNPGKFYDIYGGTHSAGLLMAWAWGASRLIDVLEQADGTVIDPSKLGVTGCSRNGKGAFAVGVFDERIALTIAHETSTGGVPVYRLVDILNTERTDHNYYGLNWLSNDFEPFVYANNVSNAVKLPIDTHSLVAMIAPRGLLVLDNPGEPQMSAPAGHLGTAAGAEVFSALGVLGNVSYHSSVPDTGHCVYKEDYTQLLTQSIGKFLKHESDTPGQFIVGAGADGNLAEWKTWETPTLE